MISFYFLIKRFNKPRSIVVDIEQRKPKAPTKLTYTIPGVPVFEDNYEVVATDYDSWTIEYACSNKIPTGHSSKLKTNLCLN